MIKVGILATTAKPAFILGLSPQDKKGATTRRIIPTVRGTYRHAQIDQKTRRAKLEKRLEGTNS